MARGDEFDRSELEALLETRRELGADYDRALVDSFADRIERAVEERVERRVGTRPPGEVRAARPDSGGQWRQFALGAGSLFAGIPITIVPMVAADGGLPAVAVAWLGIAGVNAAHAATVNGPRRRDHERRR